MFVLMSADDPARHMLDELTACAYRLGLAFGQEAERAQAWARKIEYAQLFERCFFSVRVAIGLRLRLDRTSAVARAAHDPRQDQRERGREPPERLERADAIDPPEREGDLAPERDRDRERDVERASLPLLLKTLHGVAADAAALPGPEPAALPSLRELLAQAASTSNAPGPPPSPATGAAPAAAPAPAAATGPPRPGGGLRARLAGSAGVTTLPPRPKLVGPPLRSGATGPPRR
jgi:hypothetical protein